MKPRVLLAAALALLTAACAQLPNNNDYNAFRAADIDSILVVPARNRSTSAVAPDYLLTTIARPLAERGYYVFPVNLVKRVLEEDGLSDADLVHDMEPGRLGQMFGADAVMYVTVEKWQAQYIIVDTVVTVEISYVLKDTGTGETLWQMRQAMQYSPNAGNNSGGIVGLIGKAVAAAIAKADPNYVPLAQQVNAKAFSTPKIGLPAGPHSKMYQQDGDKF